MYLYKEKHSDIKSDICKFSNQYNIYVLENHA